MRTDEAGLNGESAGGRDQWVVVINRLRTRDEQRDYMNWKKVREVMLKDPIKAQRMLAPLRRQHQGPDLHPGRHPRQRVRGRRRRDGHHREVRDDAATAQNAAIDEVLSHAILIFNPIQNPDGRVAGTRANSNGFDLNRDFLTQSQPETRNSIRIMKKWLAPEMLDMHGYVSPMLVEATTKPHNPSIEYDLWLKWNQPRIDYNEQAMDAIGQDITRPINDWCPEGDTPSANGLCDGGRDARSRRGRGLGRLGPVLRPDVPPARRPRLVDRRDVLGHEPRPGRLPARAAAARARATART